MKTQHVPRTPTTAPRARCSRPPQLNSRNGGADPLCSSQILFFSTLKYVWDTYCEQEHLWDTYCMRHLLYTSPWARDTATEIHRSRKGTQGQGRERKTGLPHRATCLLPPPLSQLTSSGHDPNCPFPHCLRPTVLPFTYPHPTSPRSPTPLNTLSTKALLRHSSL